MKMMGVLLVVAVLSLAREAGAQANRLERVGGSFSKERPAVPVAAAALVDLQSPWRIINGQTCNVFKADDWYLVTGRVIQCKDGTVLVSGNVTRRTSSGDEVGWQEITYMVKNLPWGLIDDDKVPSQTYALHVGSTEYTTVLGAKKTVRTFDYGQAGEAPKPEVYIPIIIKTPAQLEEEKKIDANRLKFTLSQATNGVASAQYDLAMRYLEGRGVEKDESTARAWLEKAASKNHAYAKRALATLGVKE